MTKFATFYEYSYSKGKVSINAENVCSIKDVTSYPAESVCEIRTRDGKCIRVFGKLEAVTKELSP